MTRYNRYRYIKGRMTFDKLVQLCDELGAAFTQKYKVLKQHEFSQLPKKKKKSKERKKKMIRHALIDNTIDHEHEVHKNVGCAAQPVQRLQKPGVPTDRWTCFHLSLGSETLWNQI